MTSLSVIRNHGFSADLYITQFYELSGWYVVCFKHVDFYSCTKIFHRYKYNRIFHFFHAYTYRPTTQFNFKFFEHVSNCQSLNG